MRANLGSIVREHFRACAQRYALSADQFHAARQIGRCRTPALGGHVQACPEGHIQRIWYHSCRHRSCPQCQALATEQWLERLKTRLLPTAHHHLIFTIPHELNALWCANRRAMGERLFEAAHASLSAFLDDARYLGASAGMVMALHSWGRSLAVHPHVHVLLTDGGLDEQGGWRTPRRSHLLPVRALMQLFRGKLLSALRLGLEDGSLSLPPSCDRGDWRRCLKRLHRLKWNVHLQARYAHGAGVACYLARYVRGGALRNTQILEADQRQVRFGYHDHAQARGVQLSLSPASFLQRVLCHVAPKGQHQLRAFGLYAPRAKDKRQRAREQLDPQTGPEAPARALHWSEFLQRFGRPRSHTHCPICAKPLVARQRIACAPAPS